MDVLAHTLWIGAGMNDHLAKPLQSDELHRTVLQWLRAAAT